MRGAAFLCTGVAHLADGDLFLVARFRPRRPERASTVHGALTVGTGAYAGARGTFTSTGEPSTYTFHISGSAGRSSFSGPGQSFGHAVVPFVVPC